MNNSCTSERFRIWYDEAYPKRLDDNMLIALLSAQRKDKKIWEVMNFDNDRENFFAGNVPISNGQVMELSGSLCRRSMASLQESLAGSHSPMNDRDIHDVMCSSECLLNDKLRFASMNISNCDCIELSIQEANGAIQTDGSFCKENSGEYLCTDLGRCGQWQCQISDYGCRRIEYNQKEVPLKGFGNDCSGASTNLDMLFLSLIMFTSFVIMSW